MSGKGNYDMTVYIALLVWTILCSPLENTKMTCKNMTIISGKTLYLLVTFIPIWFIMAFRGKRKINQCIEKAPDLCYPFFISLGL